MRREDGYEVDRRASNWTGASTVLGEMARIFFLSTAVRRDLRASLSRLSLSRSPPPECDLGCHARAAAG